MCPGGTPDGALLRKKQGTGREGRSQGILRRLQGKATSEMTTEEIAAKTRGGD